MDKSTLYGKKQILVQADCYIDIVSLTDIQLQ